MKIFWTWQSDTPGKTGRFLIRDALNEAITELKQSPDIVEEPTTATTREALHLDHDIQGTTGSPDLAQTIFEKIDASEVVIADVTIVGAVVRPSEASPVTNQKPVINSNVAIELGYALRALGTRNVVLVFNRHYGTHEDLPFDLRHKGGAVTFDLPPGADVKAIKEQRNELRARFVHTLKPFLQTAAPAEPFTETATTFSPAAYFEKGAPLASRDGIAGGRVTYSYIAERLCYIRLIPVRPLPAALSLSALSQLANRAPLLSRNYGSIGDRNAFGAIALEADDHPPQGPAGIVASTQLFPNGEIWAISAGLIADHTSGGPTDYKYPFLPSLLFEYLYYSKLAELLTFAAKDLGLWAPWQIECGIVRSDGLHIVVRRRSDEFWGPIFNRYVVIRRTLNKTDREAQDAVLLAFFNAVYDAAGKQRPDGQFGFPPNAPCL